jgi:DNA-binding response OmpR family regulator
MYILLIEDSILLRDNIYQILKDENYVVDTASDGEIGYKKAMINDYDLIILDLMLPKMDGFTVLEYLRTNSKEVPVLILSAKSQIDDKVKALDLGSDDYLTKPFAMAELLARIRSLLRRRSNIISNVINIGDLKIDTKFKTVYRSKKKIILTAKEYELLEFLAYNKDSVINRLSLAEHIWGETLDLLTMSNFINVHISNLRKKIDFGFDKKLLNTKRGIGFILTDKDV